jgi:hypothetical protein
MVSAQRLCSHYTGAMGCFRRLPSSCIAMLTTCAVIHKSDCMKRQREVWTQACRRQAGGHGCFCFERLHGSEHMQLALMVQRFCWLQPSDVDLASLPAPAVHWNLSQPHSCPSGRGPCVCEIV